MKKLLLSLTLAGALYAPAAMHADPFFGTLGINLRNVSVTPKLTGGVPTPLDPVSGISSLNYVSAGYSGDSSPQFPIITAGTNGITGSTSLYPNGVLGGTAGSPYTLTFGNATTGDVYGTFVETGNPFIVDNSATSGGPTDPYPEDLVVRLDGIFTPGAFYTGATPAASSLLFSFTESSAGGVSYSGSGTLSVLGQNPPAVPEPSSIAMLGTAVLAGAGFLKKRLIA